MPDRRDWLNRYTTTARDMELTDAAIDLLERVSGHAAQQCIQKLKASQLRHLTKLDYAAARLGAPYPGDTNA